MKKIIVTGGRDYADWVMLQEVLIFLAPTLIIEGGALGADLMAREWAELNKIPVKTYDADWATQGPKAGPLRNLKMISENPDAIVVAFPGGKGTENCVKTAVSYNRIVLKVQA